MKFVIPFVVLCAAFSSIYALESSELDEAFNNFKIQFNKKYATPEEESLRKSIFSNNLDFIEKHNAGKRSFEMGITEFLDLAPEEFSELRGIKLSPSKISGLRDSDKPMHQISNQALPVNVDYTKYDLPIKDQGHCGSCWAFSAISSIEIQYSMLTNNSVSLSEQSILDCATTSPNSGCKGGLPNVAFADIIENGGIPPNESYPYEEVQRDCRLKPEDVAVKLSGYRMIPADDEEALKDAVATVGPVTVCVYTNNYYSFYKSGIWNACPPPDRVSITHAVTVVGYGTDAEGVDYWKIRNSWGSSWGENGYGKIARNMNNTCLIAHLAAYPIVSTN